MNLHLTFELISNISFFSLSKHTVSEAYMIGDVEVSDLKGIMDVSNLLVFPAAAGGPPGQQREKERERAR